MSFILRRICAGCGRSFKRKVNVVEPMPTHCDQCRSAIGQARLDAERT